MSAGPVPSRKIVIPHPTSPDQHLTGILELRAPPPSLESSSSSAGRKKKVALILHGVMGHKDYLHQKSLARSFSQDSFRFDFRGNHESPGPFTLGHLERDIEDLVVVAKYLREVEGYQIDMIVGHSRGAVASASWISNDPIELKLGEVERFVFLCGRWRMERVHDRDPVYEPFFLAGKPWPWKVRVAGQEVVGLVTPEQVDSFAKFDNTYATERFPSHVHVLNVGGGNDSVVPPFDTLIWQRAFQARAKSACLHVVEEADHNLIGFHPEVVQLILQWSTLVQRTGKAPPLWDPSLAPAAEPSPSPAPHSTRHAML